MAVLADVRREHAYERVELEALSEESVAQLLTAHEGDNGRTTRALPLPCALALEATRTSSSSC